MRGLYTPDENVNGVSVHPRDVWSCECKPPSVDGGVRAYSILVKQTTCCLQSCHPWRRGGGSKLSVSRYRQAVPQTQPSLQPNPLCLLNLIWQISSACSLCGTLTHYFSLRWWLLSKEIFNSDSDTVTVVSVSVTLVTVTVGTEKAVRRANPALGYTGRAYDGSGTAV